MPSLPPYAIPVTIVLAVALVGAVIAFVRDRGRFSGYRHLMSEALQLAKMLDGELFRDGGDLVISGTWHKWPVQVRFSNAENTPGLSVRLAAPASINLFAGPKSAGISDGRYSLRTSDEMLNARMEFRSDHATEAKLLLDGRGILPAVTKLCQSTQTFLRITRGSVEYIDLLPPDVRCVRSLPLKLDALDAIASQLRELPGSERVRVEPLKRERRLMLRMAIVAGIVAIAAAGLIAAFGLNERVAPIAATAHPPEGVWEADAGKIPGLNKWRLASAGNFDPDALAWAQGNGVAVSGRIELDLSGNSTASDVVYVLASPDGRKRLVILRGETNVYDMQYPYIGMASRVPRTILNSIQWAGTPPIDPDGDGVLIIRAPHDPSAGIIIFTRGERIITAVPKDYRTIRLE